MDQIQCRRCKQHRSTCRGYLCYGENEEKRIEEGQKDEEVPNYFKHLHRYRLKINVKREIYEEGILRVNSLLLRTSRFNKLQKIPIAAIVGRQMT